MGVDIGPATIRAYEAAIADARTVVWNGPMGVVEQEVFAAGTNAIARAVAAVHGTTIIGGGDSIAAVKKAGVADKITHISTGGGASLEWLGGLTLRGVPVLPESGDVRSYRPSGLPGEARCAHRSSPATGRCTRRWPTP